MSTKNTYGIKQYRSNSKDGSYSTIIDGEAKFQNIDSGGKTLRDVLIIPEKSFSFTDLYCLSLDIPRNLLYDMSFQVRLENNNLTDDLYQTIRIIDVDASKEGFLKSSRVVLYVYNGTVFSDVAIDYTGQKEDGLYYNKENGKENYFLIKGTEPPINLNQFNAVIMPHSWVDDSSKTEFAHFDIVFRPIENWSNICLSMIRENVDLDLIQIDKNELYYGRTIDLDNFQWQLRQIKDLILAGKITKGNNENGIYRLAVTGDPGLVLAINNQDIKIGPSGYYELLNFNVTSFGVVDKKGDKFIVDYQWII